MKRNPVNPYGRRSTDFRTRSVPFIKKAALMNEGLNALREQFKRDPETDRLTKGSVAKTAREIGKMIERDPYKGPEDFNQEMLYALDPEEYSPYNDNPRDTFSSDEGHVRPFSGMNKDPDYYFKNPPEAQGIFPNLGTGVERRQPRSPDAPTLPPINPVLRGKKGNLQSVSKRKYYDI